MYLWRMMCCRKTASYIFKMSSLNINIYICDTEIMHWKFFLRRTNGFRDIASEYCLMILPHDINSEYCLMILPRDIASWYCRFVTDFKKVDDVAMGPTLAPSSAKALMCHHEESWLPNAWLSSSSCSTGVTSTTRPIGLAPKHTKKIELFQRKAPKFWNHWTIKFSF